MKISKFDVRHNLFILHRVGTRIFLNASIVAHLICGPSDKCLEYRSCQALAVATSGWMYTHYGSLFDSFVYCIDFITCLDGENIIEFKTNYDIKLLHGTRAAAVCRV